MKGADARMDCFSAGSVHRGMRWGRWRFRKRNDRRCFEHAADAAYSRSDAIAGAGSDSNSNSNSNADSNTDTDTHSDA